MTIASTDAPAPLGRRATNKADKLRRITAAARALFVEQGFDGTTMRDISARAGVGFGTVFDYASNKRDLLFLIANPELEATLDAGLAAAAGHDAFVDRAMALFVAYYRYYGAEKPLARLLLRELTFFSDGAEAQKFLAHRARFIDGVTGLVAAAIAAGEVRSGRAKDVARILFALFAWEVRRWLGSDSGVDVGVAELRSLLTLQVSGFAPDRPAPAGRRSAP